MTRAEDYHIYKQLNPDEPELRVKYGAPHTPAIFTKMNSAPAITETIEERQAATEKEDKAIAYYLEIFAQHGPEAATQAFWNTYK